jgi:hypothetical protein
MNGSVNDRSLGFLREKYFFDSVLEDRRYSKGQGKTGIVLAGLNGIDGLPRDIEFIRKVGLRPSAFGS